MTFCQRGSVCAVRGSAPFRAAFPQLEGSCGLGVGGLQGLDQQWTLRSTRPVVSTVASSACGQPRPRPLKMRNRHPVSVGLDRGALNWGPSGCCPCRLRCRGWGLLAPCNWAFTSAAVRMFLHDETCFGCLLCGKQGAHGRPEEWWHRHPWTSGKGGRARWGLGALWNFPRETFAWELGSHQ